MNSPLQFGKGKRPECLSCRQALQIGVSDVHLSDEIYAETVRMVSKNHALTFGAGDTGAGAGVEAVSG